MQKNWHIVYTKPKCEKKVAALLTKRKIENFCPLNHLQISSNKIKAEPLFPSYVFVYIATEGATLLKQFEGVLNLVYWKGEPATIKTEELDSIRQFTSDHHNIILERSQINAKEVNQSEYLMNGNILKIRNKALRVNLPSLGYVMVANLEPAPANQIIFATKAALIH